MDKYALYCLSYPTLHLLSSTFLRFQEHYESPKFRGAFFTWEEYMDWYAQECGAFTYLQDWSGFNLPDHVFEPFRRGEFNPLTRKEAHLLKLVSDWQRPFYVIGIERDSRVALAHELVHGVFYLNVRYRREVRRILRQHDTSAVGNHLLSTAGYCKEVLDDEVNAYLVTGLDLSGAEFSGLEQVIAELRQLFLRIFRCRVWQKRGELALLRRCTSIEI